MAAPADGIVNAVSKMPPVEPIRYLETGVNNFGNSYHRRSISRSGRSTCENGKLFYRLSDRSRGGTQVDFTPDITSSLRRR